MRFVSRSYLFLIAMAPAVALAQPSFTKAFSPNTIGPGSTTTLVYTIGNASGVAVTDLAFAHAFPGDLVVATPSNAFSSCTGGGGRDATPVIDAAEGGQTLSYSGGAVGASSSCVVQVDVTSPTPGMLASTTGDLTSSAGNSGSASATLTVAGDRPGFSASVSPAAVTLNGRSVLSYAIDNTLNAGQAYLLGFSHALPTGMTVGSPSNATTDCPGVTLAAAPGGSSVTLSGTNTAALAAGTTCTVSVDVEGNAIGRLANRTEELISTPTLLGVQRSSGVAGVALEVQPDALLLTKSFTDDPVPPGGTVTLALSLKNLDRNATATDVAFTDDLEATLAGLVATGLPFGACGGTVSSPDGGSTVELTGGTLASGETCAITLSLAVPVGAATGSYTNTTSQASATVNGQTVLGSPAVAELVVAPVPVLTMSFTNDPLGAGATATIEYSVTNTSPTANATDIAFVDDLSGIFGNTFSGTVPSAGFCGAGAMASFQPIGSTGRGLIVSGGSLSPGATCTFSVDVDVPVGVPGGVYPSTTEPVSATVDGQSLTGNAASDALTVVDVPLLSKAFPEGAVAPGGSTDLQFTLQFDTEAGSTATGVAFTDDLQAMLSGATATGLPIAACGGTLSSPDGGATLAFSGGSLSPAEVCVIELTVDIPASAPSGGVINTTSTLAATVDGVAVESPPASADLVVTALTFAKSFVDDPVAPGGTVTLDYTLTNDGAGGAATDIQFADNLSGALSGLASTSGTQTDVCGPGSQVAGTTNLVLTGGSLAPGASCTVSVTLAVPAGATPTTYTSTTSALQATVDGSPATLPAATDILIVSADEPPGFLKAFSPAAVAEGEGSTVVLTIDNVPNAAAATGLDVTDALPSGLVLATPSNATTTCTGGTLTAPDGASSFSYSGGSVAAGDACTISVDVAGTSAGQYVNTTGDLTSSLGNSGSATATLDVRAVQLSATKTAVILDDDGDGEADAGETVRYTLTLANAADRPSVALTLDDTPDPNTAVVPGSVTTTQGTVSTEAPAVSVDVGPIAAGGSATVVFDVLVDMPLDPEVLEVCNQGTVTGNDVSLLTDDPATPGLDGETCLVVDPNEPPVADAGEDQTLECEGPGGTAVALDGTGSTDPDQDELAYVWTGDFPEGGGTVTGAEPTVTFEVGEHVVALTVTDPSGLSDSDVVTTTVEDTLPPVVTLNGDAEVTLVRFSGPYVELGATAEDVCEGTLAVDISGTVDTTVPGVTVVSYTATDAAGNEGGATRTVTVIDDPDAIVSPYLALVERTATFDEQVRTEGDVHANDKIDFKKGLSTGDGGPSLHVGDLTSVDRITIHDRQRVEGDVQADRVDLKNGAVVTGTVVQSAAPFVALPTVSVSASGADVDVPDDGALTLAPGSYGKLDVGKNATLSLASGAYTFEEIKLEEGARVEVTLTTGPTLIEVEKKVDAKDDVVIVPLPFGEADSRYVLLRVEGNKVDFGKDAQVAAQIVAPDAKVTLEEGTRYVGAIIADDLDLKGATALYVTVVGPSDLVAVEGGSAGSTEADEAVASQPPPDTFELSATYPNPVRQIATVRYAMPEATTVRLSVYDALGREVALLVDGPMEAGRHQTTLVSDGLPSGTYLLRMSTADGFAQTQMLTVVR